MARLWIFCKCVTWLGLAAGAAVFLYLGEYSTMRSDIVAVCKEKNIPVPIPNARIVVSSGALTMHVYSGDMLVKSYDVAIGPGLPGVGLVKQGTPFGEYTITEKHSREDVLDRGSRHFVLGYPTIAQAANAADRGLIGDDDYRAVIDAEEAHRTPPVLATMGGPFMLQGNYFFYRNARFTDGAVAMSNADINELFEVIDVGAIVVIAE